MEEYDVADCKYLVFGLIEPEKFFICLVFGLFYQKNKNFGLWSFLLIFFFK
jgi:hypothetical protein